MSEFICCFCGGKFSTNTELDFHKTMVHLNLPKKFKCPVVECDFTTFYKCHVLQHGMMKHRFLYKCDRKIFANPVNRVSEKTYQVPKCDYCFQTFSTKTIAKTHMKNKICIKKKKVYEEKTSTGSSET